MDLKATFVLLDAARLSARIHEATAINPDHRSLYKDRAEEPLADLGPFLFAVPEKETFITWYITNGWGDAWGVLAESDVSFDELYNHFSKFLLVKTAEDEELYFRFYDPRVLKTFLPTCDKNQLEEFFGPVSRFITEGDTKETAIEFFLRNGELHQRLLKTDQIFRSLPQWSTEPPSIKLKENFVIIDDELFDRTL